ncbi:hypothetical protein ACF09Y_28825 [Streptomyces massasporeus]|uniref:hypothetical protein n=1 Tax=Streptomyces massasporeus TaxID=67324 RepID=UPI0036FC1169
MRGQQLLAWADGNSLVAWDIGRDGNEFHQRLVLVTIGGEKTIPLSDFRSVAQGQHQGAGAAFV